MQSMDIDRARARLLHQLRPNQIALDVPMKEYTTFRTGGSADLMVSPASAAEIAFVLSELEEMRIPVTIIGRGSNLIVRDGGIRGAVVRLAENFAQLRQEGNILRAQAGATLAGLVRYGHEHGLCGMEFAAGIPGTVGGAVTMNAGAYGGEIKDCAVSATVLDKAHRLREIKAAELEFGYRTSAITREGYIVLEAGFKLDHGDMDQARETLRELNQRRRDKQPLEYPSAGSTFKRPPGHFAGGLIEQAGLRGYKIGGAQVSEKHCGFIINAGGATSADILALIGAVQKRVREACGVSLETEVKIIGEER